MLVARLHYKSLIERALTRSPSVALLGPRQCGKTTLAREVASLQASHFFDLESPEDQLRLQNPEMALRPLEGLVVLDEIQTRPDLFPVLRVLADRTNHPSRFLLLGSAAPSLIRKSSETLAGRIEFINLHGFDLSEIHNPWEELWLRGGFPRSLLAKNNEDSLVWREGFIKTFLQRDLPQFGIQVPETTLRRFWTMMAHSHGQVLNSSALARSMGKSDKSIRNYIDILEQTYMLRVLPPWFENLKKRQVKAPKIFIRDSGLLLSLLTIETQKQLLSHPALGAAWEGFALEQLLRIQGFNQAYFWSTHAGAELDLFVLHKGKRLGFEFNFSEKPAITKSMHIAINDLKLDSLTIIHPGEAEARLTDQIDVKGLLSACKKGNEYA